MRRCGTLTGTGCLCSSSLPCTQSTRLHPSGLLHRSAKSGARVGRIHTPHGIIDTPGFVAVGAVPALAAAPARCSSLRRWRRLLRWLHFDLSAHAVPPLCRWAPTRRSKRWMDPGQMQARTGVVGTAMLRRAPLAAGGVRIETCPVSLPCCQPCLAAPCCAAEGQQLMFCNTYHLLLHPGADVVEAAGGLHAFMNRQLPLITDSGGFQASRACQPVGQPASLAGQPAAQRQRARAHLPSCQPVSRTPVLAHLPSWACCHRWRPLGALPCLPRPVRRGLTASRLAGLLAGLWHGARGGEQPEAGQRQEPAQAGAQPGGPCVGGGGHLSKLSVGPCGSGVG